MFSFDPKEPEEIRDKLKKSVPLWFHGDGMDLPKGATEKSLQDGLGPLQESCKRLKP